MRIVHASLVVLLLLVAAACERAKPAGSAASVAIADAGAAGAAATVEKPKKPPPPAASPDAGQSAPATAWRGDHCSADADCGWDDECMPTRCGKKAGPPQECDESAPPPGDCLCNDNMCSLKPTDPTKSASVTGKCTKDAECAVDVGGARCHVPGQSMIGPIRQQGPVCTCEASTGTCTFEWSGPVACTTWRDCSWVHEPRLRPVPSKSVRRPVNHPVRACKDGEVDSVCNKANVCEIVAWKC